MPYVFTEYGSLMVANILRSDVATDVSIYIVRAFVKMRELIANNINIQKQIKELQQKFNQHDKEIDVIFEAIKQLMEPPLEESKKQIGFIRTENPKTQYVPNSKKIPKLQISKRNKKNDK